MWKKLFVRDSFGFGMLLGLLLPATFLGVLFLLDLVFFSLFETHILAEQSYLYILSMAANLFGIKYYFVNLKYEKTGRGVLIVTFGLALAYFAIF